MGFWSFFCSSSPPPLPPAIRAKHFHSTHTNGNNANAISGMKSQSASSYATRVVVLVIFFFCVGGFLKWVSVIFHSMRYATLSWFDDMNDAESGVVVVGGGTRSTSGMTVQTFSQLYNTSIAHQQQQAKKKCCLLLQNTLQMCTLKWPVW